MTFIAKNIIIGGGIKTYPLPKEVEKVEDQFVTPPKKEIKVTEYVSLINGDPARTISSNETHHIVKDGVLEKKYHKKSSYVTDMIDLK